MEMSIVEKLPVEPNDKREPIASVYVRELSEFDYAQVNQLLAAQPLEGVHLQSLITDHGLTSQALRGQFYGYFEQDQLKGVALIGHQIMFCTPDKGLPFLAEAAAEVHPNTTVIFGQHSQVELFWHHFASFGLEMKLKRDFYWYVCESPAQPIKSFHLIQATAEHLEAVMEAHATTICETTGTDPRQTDLEGFQRRVLDRIKRGRTWIRLEGNTIVFKAELQSVTPEVIYLEGIWTHLAHRRRGIARESVVELTHRRLRKQQVLCLAVEPDEDAALRIYQHAGFHYQADYLAIYPKSLQQ